jgi:cysteine-rich repeat protein
MTLAGSARLICALALAGPGCWLDPMQIGPDEVGTSSDGDGDGDGDPTGDGDGEPTGDGDGDGEPLHECGNGVIEAGEACDDGDANALEPDACAPDCSTIIETKQLASSAEINGLAFQPNPVAYADSRCQPGYKAMFVFGNGRVATTVPWQSVGSVDWPVKPYTAYVNGQDELVWVTDDVALLAVRDGAHEDPIVEYLPCDGFCIAFTMLSGLADDGTTSVSGNCDGWTTNSQNFNFNRGSLQTLEYQTSVTPCSGLDGDDNVMTISFPRFVCVEQ